MRTSEQQFEMLITFMEEHGDISHPSKCARGRLTQLGLWDELTVLLNSEGDGVTKSMEKWRKVWSDYKSNLKKKAARIHRAAVGTGSGPALETKLSDLEFHALQIIGVEAATGLQVEEAGLSQEEQTSSAVSQQRSAVPHADTAELQVLAEVEVGIGEDGEILNEVTGPLYPLSASGTPYP